MFLPSLRVVLRFPSSVNSAVASFFFEPGSHRSPFQTREPGNILEPRLLGKSLGLNPIVIVLALGFFGVIWGVIGMFLAVPLTAIAKIVLERGESSRPLAALLDGDVEAFLSGPDAGPSSHS